MRLSRLSLEGRTWKLMEGSFTLSNLATTASSTRCSVASVSTYKPHSPQPSLTPGPSDNTP